MICQNEKSIDWYFILGERIMEKKMVEAYTFFANESDEFKKQMQVEELLVDIACEFINYRAVHDMTQKELAEKLQMTQAMVSKLESGDLELVETECARKAILNMKEKYRVETIISGQKSPLMRG